MATSRDWMFCPLTGTLLEIDPHKGTASCKASNFSCRVSELANTTVTSKTDIQDYRRRYGLDVLVKEEEEEPDLVATTRATVDEQCPKCGNNGLEFYTMQLRSADEGQTVFYECPKCRYKYSQNT